MSKTAELQDERTQLIKRWRDDLISWHNWCNCEPVAEGYPSVSPTFFECKSSTVWDWLNGSEDARLQQRRMEDLHARITNLPEQEYYAISEIANKLVQKMNNKNFIDVWSNPKLPLGVARLELDIKALRSLT